MSGTGGADGDERLGPGTLIWLVLVSVAILVGMAVFLISTLT